MGEQYQTAEAKAREARAHDDVSHFYQQLASVDVALL